jgi:cytoskeletal protein CcmA (bactofilin family)
MANEKSKGGMTLLGAGTVFEGKIEVPHELSIHGEYTGEILCKGHVTVGIKGVVKANIDAKTAVIDGRVEGNLTCSGSVELAGNSVLIGNINAKELIINKGATFQGNSSMGVESAPVDVENLTK